MTAEQSRFVMFWASFGRRMFVAAAKRLLRDEGAVCAEECERWSVSEAGGHTLVKSVLALL